MTQEIGETRDAFIEEDNKKIAQILDANKNRKDPYWIVLFAKPSKVLVDGKHAVITHIKPYPVKPSSQVGMITGEVDNSKGTIKWEVNMPDVPFDFDGLQKFGVERTNDVVVETTTIADAYVTR